MKKRAKLMRDRKVFGRRPVPGHSNCQVTCEIRQPVGRYVDRRETREEINMELDCVVV